MGRAQVVGHGDIAMEHLQTVNGWSAEQARAYVDAAFGKWANRSRKKGWKLIVNWEAIAGEYGVTLSLRGTLEYPARPNMPEGE
jgi:hypothetical protein